jgi:hypothetical protein
MIKSKKNLQPEIAKYEKEQAARLDRKTDPLAGVLSHENQWQAYKDKKKRYGLGGIGGTGPSKRQQIRDLYDDWNWDDFISGKQGGIHIDFSRGKDPITDTFLDVTDFIKSIPKKISGWPPVGSRKKK